MVRDITVVILHSFRRDAEVSVLHLYGKHYIHMMHEYVVYMSSRMCTLASCSKWRIVAADYTCDTFVEDEGARKSVLIHLVRLVHHQLYIYGKPTHPPIHPMFTIPTNFKHPRPALGKSTMCIRHSHR